MGIRLHKFLGYALIDVATTKDGYQLNDPRINKDSAVFEVHDERELLADYLPWLKKNSLDQYTFPDGHVAPMSLDYGCLVGLLELDRENPSLKGRMLRDCVAWSPEYGLKNVLVIQPWACHDWSHYDDMIDYTAETYLFGRDPEYQRDRVDVLPSGIYPWNDSFMDAETGEKKGFGGDLHFWLRCINANNTILEADRRGLPRPARTELYSDETLNRMAIELGYESHEEALRRVVPWVPFEVRDLANYTKLFTNDEIWKQLRPALYTYWS